MRPARCVSADGRLWPTEYAAGKFVRLVAPPARAQAQARAAGETSRTGSWLT